MTRFGTTLAAIGASALLLTGVGQVPAASAQTLPDERQCGKLENPDDATKGWCLAIIRRKGNCLACHAMVVTGWPATLPPGGNIAPPLVAMKQRYPDKAKLRAQIANPLEMNPQSVMPPFGTHKLLNDEEIDLIVEFLSTI